MIEHSKAEQVQEAKAVIAQMLPDKAALALADKHTRMLVLSQGQFEDGTEYYAYLAVPPSKYLELMQRQLDGTSGYRLSDYGEILEWCEGTREPPEDVRRYMADTYGASPHFARDMAELAQKALGQKG